MFTIGINAAFHDSSACILKDGQLLAAAEEERFTHVKHREPFIKIPFYSSATTNNEWNNPRDPLFLTSIINAPGQLIDGYPHHLQNRFKGTKLTGVPVLVNTSFNTLGKPIVCSPRDAVECFWSSPFDALIIGSFIVEK